MTDPAPIFYTIPPSFDPKARLLEPEIAMLGYARNLEEAKEVAINELPKYPQWPWPRHPGHVVYFRKLNEYWIWETHHELPAAAAGVLPLLDEAPK
jgi:hypothetical protein